MLHRITAVTSKLMKLIAPLRVGTRITAIWFRRLDFSSSLRLPLTLIGLASSTLGAGIHLLAMFTIQTRTGSKIRSWY